jgi:transcriptional regulator with XRE-family HTH domain
VARDRLAARRKAIGLSQEQLAHRLGVERTTVGRWEQGTSTPQPWQRRSLADELGVGLDELADLLALDSDAASDLAPGWAWKTVEAPGLEDLEALELIRRVEASDVGAETTAALELAVDRLCRSYTNTAPDELLAPLRGYRGYLVRLLDGHATLAQRRELMVLAGWLSLMTAICDIDLHQYRAAATNLDAARSLAHEAGYPLLAGWALETEGWQAITDGHYRRAVQLCRAGRDLVPTDTSGYVQLSVQEARASARLGLAKETHRLLDDAATALDRMPTPDNPEHHFVFDPRKLVGYTATTLAWLGDDNGLAEEYAQQAVDQYDVGATDGRWVRRLALARIDLALVLSRIGEAEEAARLGSLAVGSGRLVSSNIWRLDELDDELMSRYAAMAEVNDLHEQRLALDRSTA